MGPAPLLTFEYHVRFQEGPRKKADVAPWRAVYWPGGNTGATWTRDSHNPSITDLSGFFFFNIAVLMWLNVNYHTGFERMGLF